MPFVTDKQTLDDLNLLGKYKNNSVINLFNLTRTAGAEHLLESMFQQPLTSVANINRRSQIFQYFQSKKLDFPFETEALSATENYLSGASASNILMAAGQNARRKLLYYMGLRVEHDLIANGLLTAIKMLASIGGFISGLLQQDSQSPFAAELQKANLIFNGNKLKWLESVNIAGPLSFFQTVRCDYLLRTTLRDEIEVILELVHAMDVFIAVTDVSRAKGFSYALALPAEKDVLHIEAGFHPCLEKAVPNTADLDADNNVIFLTGANMAGKSTFMKSFGISVYLAHMGFPVPAKSMTFSVKDGIYTSINVPDDLNMGYSHFYAEVLRVKKIAEEVSAPKSLVVIFDELFKGTNVKDAYDATLAVSEVFAEHRNCFFIISTHIVEVGEVLGQRSDNIRFIYMPTEMNGKIPVYTYRAKQGISSDRHGMMIIENEKILEIIG
ncbi:DNA mismatch repair protein [Pedobacter hiemivivus]|uniref:DNA mismatch repair protein n=1 Tax=Pedobacter hiemivivus TaxID=2530454 RepID=A0A4U1GQL1_9SPHI|nr:DNA mismatch repair protein [Pedobacter hiemivivus]TKC65463.1 DNA mismatch repair protein [Pedobacter hiemivivus]